MSGIGDFVNAALGLDAETLGVVQMALRALITYFVALAFVRIGDKRFLGKSTAFDVVIAIMFGSVMSRAITTAGEFGPVLAAGAVLVGLHFLVALITFRSDEVGSIVKGRERTLVRDGEIQWEEMATAHVTERDLRGALRAEGRVEDLGKVRLATLERSGDISVITREPD
jgi:uncharacterized membrane protein YcaP (DUF421 family)